MTWRSRAASYRKSPAAGEKAIVGAYREVFGRKDASTEMVLADLAAQTGFYLVEPPGVDLSLYQAGYNAGQRAAFGRLFHFLSLSDEQLQALETAARAEAAYQPEE